MPMQKKQKKSLHDHSFCNGQTITPRKLKNNSEYNNSDQKRKAKVLSVFMLKKTIFPRRRERKTIKEKKDKCEEEQVKSVKNPKDIATNDRKGKQKATKQGTEIEKEELDVLQSVAATTKKPLNKDNFICLVNAWQLK